MGKTGKEKRRKNEKKRKAFFEFQPIDGRGVLAVKLLTHLPPHAPETAPLQE